jgi:hypothetical protein
LGIRINTEGREHRGHREEKEAKGRSKEARKKQRSVC